MKIIIILTVSFFIFSCSENKEAKIVKRIENCADKVWFDRYKINKESISKAISRKKRYITENKELINFLIKEENYFSSSQGAKEHTVDKYIIKKEKKKKNIYYDYAQMLGTEFTNLRSYEKKNLSEKKRNIIRENQKKSTMTRYMMEPYEDSLKGFKTWINFYKDRNLKYENDIKELKSSEGRKKWYDKQAKDVKLENESLKTYLKQELKTKLGSNFYNNKFIECEQLRKRASIAFDEKWK